MDVHTSSTEPAPLSDIDAISSAHTHTCALTTSGNVKCWGNGYAGKLGNGGGTNQLAPVDVRTSASNEDPLSDIEAIGTGIYHTCALTVDGNVKCWGTTAYLGSGGINSQSAPLDVHTSSTESAPLSDIDAISVGYRHTCALTVDGNVKCWGEGASGKLGNGDITNQLAPVDVLTSSSTPLGGIAAISPGYHHTCALTTDGNVKCWGQGSNGKLGNNGTRKSNSPVDVHTSSSDDTPLGGIAAIHSGFYHTCALTTDGNVKCWGQGASGKLGNGNIGNKSTPVDILLP